jgi:hypothetical protein
VDQEILVTELRKFAERVESTAGPVALLMLLAPDVESDDAWNLIVSARGLNHEPRSIAVTRLTQLLRAAVNRTLWSRIGRATVLRTDDPFVRAINTAFSTNGNVVNIQSCNIAGMDIPKAILFVSNRRQ